MSEWWTYTLGDFLLFAPPTYYRLFELYNRDIWPGQTVAATLGLAIAMLVLGGARAPNGRLVAAILAACWAWVAGAFHIERYATINWAAVYFAAAFALESALLVWTGVIRGRLVFALAHDNVRRAGFLLFAFALVGQPLLGLLAGRSWMQVEIFGVAPDPTAVGTLGIVLTATRGRHWPLLVVPLAWCAVSGAFLHAMAAPDALTMPVAGVAAIVLALLKRESRPA